MKNRADSLPAEQKEQIRERIKSRLDSLSPAEKRKLLKEYRKHKNG